MCAEINPKTTDFHLQEWRHYEDLYGRVNISLPLVLLNIPVLVVIVALIFFFRDTFSTREGEDAFVIVPLLLWCVSMIGFFIFHGKKIWKRNVVGYNLWISRLTDLVPEHREVYGWVVPRGQTSYSHMSRCAIVIPLGGWFNERPRISYGPKYQLLDPKVYWHLGNFHLSSNGLITDSTIKIKTRHGEAMETSVTFALDLFNHFLDEGDVPPVMPLGMVFSENIRAKIENTAKIEKLLDVLTNTAQAIADTKRFGKSKEGAKIREQLTSELLKILPDNDPRRNVLEPAKPAA